MFQIATGGVHCPTNTKESDVMKKILLVVFAILALGSIVRFAHAQLDRHNCPIDGMMLLWKRTKYKIGGGKAELWCHTTYDPAEGGQVEHCFWYTDN